MLTSLLGLLGALVYGSADFLGGLAAKRLRSLAVTAIAAFSGLAALVLAAALIEGEWSAHDAAWGAVSGLFSVAAIGLLYACLATGPMSILSPITALTSALAPLAWALVVEDERPGALGALGLALALVAVVLVAFLPGRAVRRPSGRSVAMATGSGLSIGAFLVALAQTNADSGLTPLIASRATTGVVTALIVLGIGAFVSRRIARTAPDAPRPPVLRLAVAPIGRQVGFSPSGRADLDRAYRHRITRPIPIASARPSPLGTGIALALACGVVDATANALILVALRIGDLSVVSVLAALYPAGTILLAALLLRERVAPRQWLGLALALTAAGLLAVA